tara:strand:+ start:410 stop:1057 length:648 start_codon:yes stop_codon:yes gene_type:complete
MPNWCLNTVEFIGSPSKIEKIRKAVEEDDGLFQSLIPMPTELKDTVSGSESAKSDWQKENAGRLYMKHGADNWYDWNVNNWGTKWDASEICIDDISIDFKDPSSSSIQVSFQTAWSPPTRFYDALLEKMNEKRNHFSINATYYEPGVNFMGVWSNENDCTYSVEEQEDKFFTDHEDGEIINAHYGILEQRIMDRENALEEVQEWYEDGKKDLNLA